tara:strand:+ start:6935 stop:7579 length:645 start_codon:yes stop_codon:yes gene_type:complete
MRRILITNNKGGCGKSTLATNLAAYFANEGVTTSLADYDEQGSSLEWLNRRSDKFPKISSLRGYKDGLKYMPKTNEVLVIDAPARSSNKELTNLINHIDTILVPVMPSSIDMEASANYITEILNRNKIQNKQAKVALIANRVRENTIIFDELDDFLDSYKIPYIATLRETQNYIKSFQKGLGIHEMPPYLAWKDWEQWEPIIDWLNSKKSKVSK